MTMEKHWSANSLVAQVLLIYLVWTNVGAQGTQTKGGWPGNPQQNQQTNVHQGSQGSSTPDSKAPKVSGWPSDPQQNQQTHFQPSKPSYPQQNPQTNVHPAPQQTRPTYPQQAKVVAIPQPAMPSYPQQHPQTNVHQGSQGSSTPDSKAPKVGGWPSDPQQNQQTHFQPSKPSYPQQNPQTNVHPIPQQTRPSDPQQNQQTHFQMDAKPSYPQQNPQTNFQPAKPSYPQQNPQTHFQPAKPSYPQQNPQTHFQPAKPSYPQQNPQTNFQPAKPSYPQQNPQTNVHPAPQQTRPTYPQQNLQTKVVPIPQQTRPSDPQQNLQTKVVPIPQQTRPSDPQQNQQTHFQMDAKPSYPQQNPQTHFQPAKPSYPQQNPQTNFQPSKPSYPQQNPQTHFQPAKPSYPQQNPQTNFQPAKPSYPQQNPQTNFQPSKPSYPQQNPQTNFHQGSHGSSTQDSKAPQGVRWPSYPQTKHQQDAKKSHPQQNQKDPSQYNPYRLYNDYSAQEPYVPPQQKTQQQQHLPEATREHSCEVEQSVRIPCGGHDITGAVCEAINCCFDGRQCYFGKAVTVQCTKDAQFIVVVARDATEPYIDLSKISLLGEGQGCMQVDSNSAFSIYQFPVTACGSVIMEEPGVIIYENRMSSSYEFQVGPDGIITRDSFFELLFQCRYVGTSVETLVIEVFPLQDPLIPVAALGPMRVQLRLANGECQTKGCNEVQAAYSSFYTEADYPVTKVLRQAVYVDVGLVDKTDPNLVLTLGHCWTTMGPNPHNLPQWDILIDGCPYRDDRYMSSLVPVDSSSGLAFPSHYRRFFFKMFAFVDSSSLVALQEQVYIHCSTAVCTAGGGVSCEPSCFRKRRQAEQTQQPRIEPRVVASFGPLIMVDNSQAETV